MTENTLNLSLYKTSSAGTNVDDNEDKLKVNFEYILTDYFFVFFGTTRMPKSIRFTCIVTNEVFEVLTDYDLIKHYMLYRRK